VGWSSFAIRRDTITAMPGREPLLVSRREIDLVRVAGAGCPSHR
jgi:hypothetical protein